MINITQQDITPETFETDLRGSDFLQQYTQTSSDTTPYEVFIEYLIHLENRIKQLEAV